MPLVKIDIDKSCTWHKRQGVTIDDVAVAAMQGILSNPEEFKDIQKCSKDHALPTSVIVANRAYSIARAMQAESERAEDSPE